MAKKISKHDLERLKGRLRYALEYKQKMESLIEELTREIAEQELQTMPDTYVLKPYQKGTNVHASDNMAGS